MLMSNVSFSIPEMPNAVHGYIHPGACCVATSNGSHTVVLDGRGTAREIKRDVANQTKAYEFAKNFFQYHGKWDHWNTEMFHDFAKGLNRHIVGVSRGEYRWEGVSYLMKDRNAPLVLLPNRDFYNYLKRNGSNLAEVFKEFYRDYSHGFAKELETCTKMDPIGASSILPSKIKAALKEYIWMFPSNFNVEGMMGKLLEDLKRKKDPIERAALLHTRLVGIHPFRDGNGRVARMMMNIALMMDRLPPLFFASEREYDQAAALANEKPDSFEPFLRDQMKKLMGTMIEGETICPNDPYAYAAYLPLKNQKFLNEIPESAQRWTTVVPIKKEGMQRKMIQIGIALTIVAILGGILQKTVYASPSP